MLSKTPFVIPRPLIEKAKGAPRLPMAIAGAGHPVALESARRAAEIGLIEPVLIGEPDVTRRVARELGWDIAGWRLVPAGDESKAAEVAVALARGGEVASIMKGHVHTDALMRAVLKRDVGLRTDRRTSHVFHMTVPGHDGALLIADAVVNIQPTVDDKIHIILNAVDLAHALGNPLPKVAILSGAETVNPSMPSSVEAAEVAKRAHDGAIVGAIVDGPLGFDNAVSPEAARIKGIDSPVAGRADILIVPNLEAGNFLFKQMVYFMSAVAAGLVMGTKVPIVLTSRADPPEARLAATAIAAIMAGTK